MTMENSNDLKREKSRREFLKKTSIGVSAITFSGLPVFAGPFDYEVKKHLIPEDKKLTKAWIKSLYERGEPEVLHAEKGQLKYIGMPVGGITCGQLYIGGDGKLWMWHIFRTRYQRNPDSQLLDRMEQGGHYAHPDRIFLREERPVDQGVAIRVNHKGNHQRVELKRF